MKLGLFGARADSRGLCYQTQAFAKWLQPERVWGIDMTTDSLSPYPNDWKPYLDWTDDLTVTRHSQVAEDEVRAWLRGLDVVIGAETFYRDNFPIWAREEGVRTVCQVNPEFYGWEQPKGRGIPKPDVCIAPTTWRLEKMPGVSHVPFPVDRELFPFRLRISAKTFVHIAGHRAAADRAGTRIVMGELGRLKGVNIVIRSQSPLGFEGPVLRRAKVEQMNFDHPCELYHDADVVILPRRYGGNSLVANEALSSGCPVIALDRAPENSWGGVKAIATRPRGHLRTNAGMIPLIDAKPGALSRAIHEFKDNEDMVRMYSQAADVYAQTISWELMLPRYWNFLEQLVTC